ncbi:MAG: hypothetical protein ABIH57_01955 [Candidatus Omnitrophota bacterium]
MKKRTFFMCTIVFFSIVLTVKSYAETQEKIDELKEKYSTTISSFNGEVTVDTIDGKMEINLKPGEALIVPKNLPPKKEPVTWKDVAQYENMLSREDDPITQWFIENLWRDRINKTLLVVRKGLEKKYTGKEISKHFSSREGQEASRNLIKSIQEALGLPDRGPYTDKPWFILPAFPSGIGIFSNKDFIMYQTSELPHADLVWRDEPIPTDKDEDPKIRAASQYR